MTFSLIDSPSPNFSPRQSVDGVVGVRHVVLHYTGMVSAGGALDRLRDPAAQVSAHYLIAEGGAAHRLVAEDMRAWHAGKSFWRGVRDLNSTSIGIELVNPGHDHGYRRFPEAQIASLLALLAGIVARHGVSADNIVGHSDIAPGRKSDPGELFPWQTLAKAGFGLWPVSAAPTVPDMDAAFRQLSGIGYPVPLAPELGGDLLDPKSAAADVVTAFQRRFRPGAVDGILDRETAALIAAVNLRYAEAGGAGRTDLPA